MISDRPLDSRALTAQDAVNAVRAAAGWARLDRLSLIRVKGPQRVKFLHNLLSNDIASLGAGASRQAALMNLKGQQVAWMTVMAESDALVCELPAAVRDVVVDTFVHYKVGAPVRFEKSETRAFGVLGAGAVASLRELGLAAPLPDNHSFANGEIGGRKALVSRSQSMPANGLSIHVALDDAEFVATSLRERLGDELTPRIVDTLRVEEGIPWHGIDVAEENLLHETGQLAVYHSPSKGCYLGQEVVARLEGRGGNVNKRLVGFRGVEPMRAGDEVRADDKVVGRITTAGESPEFGPIAMGYVHRSHAEPGSTVVVRDRAVTVAPLPFRS